MNEIKLGFEVISYGIGIFATGFTAGSVCAKCFIKSSIKKQKRLIKRLRHINENLKKENENLKNELPLKDRQISNLENRLISNRHNPIWRI